MEEIIKYLNDNHITYTKHKNMITYEGADHWWVINYSTFKDINDIPKIIKQIKANVK